MSPARLSCSPTTQGAGSGGSRISKGAPALGLVSTFTAACLLVSNMIGTGIFGTTGFMAADLGRPWLILALWVFGGFYSLLGAFCYSELGAAMPKAGGEYVYLRAAYGPLMGFLSGWTSFTVGFAAAIAAAAHLFGDHVRAIVPALGGAGEGGGFLEEWAVLELALVWGLTVVHVGGVAAGGFVQRLLTVVKIGAILALILAGLASGNGNWSHFRPGDAADPVALNVILVSFMFVTFSYSGWNAASYIAHEIRDPRRSLPRAIVWGTLTVTVVYIGVNVVYLYAMSIPELASDPIDLVGAKTSAALFGPAIDPWFTSLLAVSIVGAASAMIWAGPRVYYAMASDRVFPKTFSKLSAGGGVPVRSIVLQSLWISVLILTGTFETLLLYATFVLVLFSALAVSCVVVLRRTQPTLQRPYRVQAYPWVPLVYIAISIAILWAALQIRPVESLLGLVTVLAGVPFYLIWRKRAVSA